MTVLVELNVELVKALVDADADVVHGSLAVVAMVDLEDTCDVVETAAVVFDVGGAEVCEGDAGVDWGGFTPVLGTG